MMRELSVVWLYNIFDIIFKKADGLAHIQRSYKVKFCSNARPLVYTEAHRAQAREQRWVRKRMCAEKGCRLSACAHDAHLWGRIPAHLWQMAENEKSGWISLNSPWNWLVSRSTEAGLCTCKLNKLKEEKNKPKWGRNLIPFPSGVTNLFAPFSSPWWANKRCLHAQLGLVEHDSCRGKG